MIPVNHQHRKLADQVQALPEHIRNRCIIRLLIIGIQIQNGARQAVHHIPAWRLHNDIPDEIRRKRTPLYKRIMKNRKFLLIRQLAKQQKIRDLLKSKCLLLKESPHKILNIIAAVIQITRTGYFLPSHNLLCTYIRYVRQAGKHALSI